MSYAFVSLHPGDVAVPLKYSCGGFVATPGGLIRPAWPIGRPGLCVGHVEHEGPPDRVPGTYIATSTGLAHTRHTALRSENLRVVRP